MHIPASFALLVSFYTVFALCVGDSQPLSLEIKISDIVATAVVDFVNPTKPLVSGACSTENQAAAPLLPEIAPSPTPNAKIDQPVANLTTGLVQPPAASSVSLTSLTPPVVPNSVANTVPNSVANTTPNSVANPTPNRNVPTLPPGSVLTSGSERRRSAPLQVLGYLGG